MIETIVQSFAAGEVKTFSVSGNYFELIDAPSGGVDVILSDRSGGQLASMRNIGAGYFVRPGPYEVVQITSASAQSISFFVADGDAGTRRLSGNVTVTSAPAVVLPVLSNLANAQATVTTTSAQLLAANAARKYLLVQNKDPVGTIWLGWGTVTQANGIRVPPGGFYELPDYNTTQALSAIGDLASNANIVTVQGG